MARLIKLWLTSGADRQLAFRWGVKIGSGEVGVGIAAASSGDVSPGAEIVAGAHGAA